MAYRRVNSLARQLSLAKTPPTKDWVINGLTHFFRIPLATPGTCTLLAKSFDALKNDRALANVPHIAWRTIDSLGISLGELALENDTQIREACKALETLNIGFDNEIEPLGEMKITLKGLSSGRPDEQRPFTHDLSASIIDHGCISNLRRRLHRIFDEQQLPYRSKRVRRPGHDESLRQVKIMTTAYLNCEQPNLKPTLNQYGISRRVKVDARDVFATYGNTVWIEDLPLKKLCISTIGLKDIVKNGEIIGQGYEDICSVPLLDRSNIEEEEERPDIVEYVRASMNFTSNKIKCPFIITSDPNPEAAQAAYEEFNMSIARQRQCARQ